MKRVTIEPKTRPLILIFAHDNLNLKQLCLEPKKHIATCSYITFGHEDSLLHYNLATDTHGRRIPDWTPESISLLDTLINDKIDQKKIAEKLDLTQYEVKLLVVEPNYGFPGERLNSVFIHLCNKYPQAKMVVLSGSIDVLLAAVAYRIHQIDASRMPITVMRKELISPVAVNKYKQLKALHQEFFLDLQVDPKNYDINKGDFEMELFGALASSIMSVINPTRQAQIHMIIFNSDQLCDKAYAAYEASDKHDTDLDNLNAALKTILLNKDQEIFAIYKAYIDEQAAAEKLSLIAIEASQAQTKDARSKDARDPEMDCLPEPRSTELHTSHDKNSTIESKAKDDLIDDVLDTPPSCCCPCWGSSKKVTPTPRDPSIVHRRTIT